MATEEPLLNVPDKRLNAEALHMQNWDKRLLICSSWMSFYVLFEMDFRVRNLLCLSWIYLKMYDMKLVKGSKKQVA